jgi:hypothetical protein
MRSMISYMLSTGQVLDSDDSKTLSFAELSVGLRKLNVSDTGRSANAQCKFLIDCYNGLFTDASIIRQVHPTIHLSSEDFAQITDSR